MRGRAVRPRGRMTLVPGSTQSGARPRGGVERGLPRAQPRRSAALRTAGSRSGSTTVRGPWTTSPVSVGRAVGPGRRRRRWGLAGGARGRALGGRAGRPPRPGGRAGPAAPRLDRPGRAGWPGCRQQPPTRLEQLGVDAALAEVDDGSWVSAELRAAWPTYGSDLAPALRATSESPGPTLEALSRIRVPVGLVGLVGDPFHPIEVARAWCDALPWAALVELDQDAPAVGRHVLGHAALSALGAGRRSGGGRAERRPAASGSR